MVLADVEHCCTEVKLVEELPQMNINSDCLCFCLCLCLCLCSFICICINFTNLSVFVFVFHLGDEEVHLQHVSHIFPLNLSVRNVFLKTIFVKQNKNLSTSMNHSKLRCVGQIHKKYTWAKFSGNMYNCTFTNRMP